MPNAIPALTRSGTSRAERDGRRDVLLVAGVAIVASIMGLSNGFTSDDIPLIRDNAIVHGLSQLGTIFTSPYWPPPAPPDLYRPLASLLIALQWVSGFGSPLVFRAVSVVLYAAASVAVLRLAHRLVPRSIALAVAVLFAAHPVHVEAVALGVNQGEIVVGLLCLLATGIYIDRRRDSRLSLGNWLAIAAMYGVACLFKESALVLPALLLTAEVVLIAPSPPAERVRALWRGYALLLILGGMVITARTAVLSGNAVGSFTAEALAGLSMSGRALTMLQVVPHWIRLMVWPVHLRIDYSPGEIVASTGFGLRETVGLAIAIALIAAIIVTWRRAPVVAFGLLWFVISLLPVSNVLIPTGVLLAERTLFLPSIGFLLALGGATEYALRNAMISTHRREIAIAAAALALAAVARSVSRQRIWHDPQTLALASVRDAPRSWRVQRAYGEALFDAGKAADGIQAYARSIQWAPEPWFVRNSLSRRLRQLGDDAGAVGQLHESLRQRPGQREATAELAAALLGLGHYAEARRLADSVIVADNAPPIMVWLRRVADSAAAAGARPGSIKVGVRGP